MDIHLTVKEFANMIDHTLANPTATDEDFKVFCKEALDYGFKSVAMYSSRVQFCAHELKGTKVLIGGAVGSPIGQNTIATKVFETKDAINNGSDEIDFLLNIAEIKMGNWDYVEKEMKSIVSICMENNVVSKVILENFYLNDNEKIAVCEIAKRVKPDFVKTSTGFAKGGATVHDVKLMKKVVGDSVKVKAAGQIRDFETAKIMILAGADRIGTSSGVRIVEEYKKIINNK